MHPIYRHRHGLIASALALAIVVPANAAALFKYVPGRSQNALVAEQMAQPATKALALLDYDGAGFDASTASLTLTLPTGGLVTAKQTRFEAQADGSRIWYGNFAASAILPGADVKTVIDAGSVVLVSQGKTITGSLQFAGRFYAIRPLENGMHAVMEINQARLPPDHEPAEQTSLLKATAPTQADIQASMEAPAVMAFPAYPDTSLFFVARNAANGPATGRWGGSMTSANLTVPATGSDGTRMQIHLRGWRNATGAGSEGYLYPMDNAITVGGYGADTPSALIVTIEPADNPTLVPGVRYTTAKADLVTLGARAWHRPGSPLIKTFTLGVDMTFSTDRVSNARLTDTEPRAVLPNIETTDGFGFYTTAYDASVGPVQGHWGDCGSGFNMYKVPVLDENGRSAIANVRASRTPDSMNGDVGPVWDAACGYSEAPAAAGSALVLEFRKEDNPQLTSAYYRTQKSVMLATRPWHGKNIPGIAKTVRLDLNVKMQPGFVPVPTTLRVLVVSNAAGESVAGAKLSSLAPLLIAEANEGLRNSGVPVRYELAGTAITQYAQSGTTKTDLGRLRAPTDGYMDEVHALRKEKAADMVVAIMPASGSCGTGYVNANATSAFAVVSASCTKAGAYSFAHELGHNLGAQHDTAQTNTAGENHGYKSAGKWRTVMSYDCAAPSNCPRVNYWSSPYLRYNGEPMGTALRENNARTLENKRFDAGNWRNQL